MPAPTCTTAPVISGTATAGSQLTATHGLWDNKEPVSVVKIASGALKTQVDVEAAEVAGDQGDRELTATIFSASGAAIDPVRKHVRIPFYEGGTPIGGNWWNNLGPTRSGRADNRRTGPSYWSSQAPIDTYEETIGYADAFNGPMAMGNNTAKPDYNISLTDQRVLGGLLAGSNKTERNDIDPKGQFNWTENDGGAHWPSCWKILPKGVICGFSWISTSDQQKTTTNVKNQPGDSSIWQEIINGDWDIDYKNMGRRFYRAQQDKNPRGHDMDHIMVRMNHENNQTNHNQVFNLEVNRYKRSHERIIDLIRAGINAEGGNGSDLKFFHAPAAYNTTPGGVGRYLDMCPDNVDGYSVSWHPKRSENTTAKVTLLMQEDLNSFDFHLEEVANCSAKKNKPMLFPEWSPRYEVTNSGVIVACPRSYDCTKAFDQFLTDHNSMIVANMVFSISILNPNAYEYTDTEGKNEWKNMANNFPTRFGGPNKKP